MWVAASTVGNNCTRAGVTNAAAAGRPGNSTRGNSPGANLLQGYGNIPLGFVQNQGQTDPSVTYLSQGGGYGLYLLTYIR